VHVAQFCDKYLALLWCVETQRVEATSDKLQHVAKPKLLGVDEPGYLPFGPMRRICSSNRQRAL
jgi:hypothetical protein